MLFLLGNGLCLVVILHCAKEINEVNKLVLEGCKMILVVAKD